MCEMFCAPNLLGYPSLQSSEPEDELRHLPANCKSPKRLSTFRNPRRMNFFSRPATKQPQIQHPSWKRLNPTPPSTIFPSAFIAIQLLQCNQKSKVGTPKKSTKRNHGACKTPKNLGHSQPKKHGKNLSSIKSSSPNSIHIPGHDKVQPNSYFNNLSFLTAI